jgi:hypothetical protein
LPRLIPGGREERPAEQKTERARLQPAERSQPRDLAGEQLAVQADVARLVAQQSA